jgi:four helix bundle protein
MEAKVQKFEDLNIWKDSMDLSVDIYKLFRQSKDWGLRDQIQRASVSVPSNIAEGFDRQSNNEFIRFLKIAKGSCAEVRTQLMIAQRIGEIEESKELLNRTMSLSKMIQGMINYREEFRK